MEENSEKDYTDFHEMGLDDRILKVCLHTCGVTINRTGPHRTAVVVLSRRHTHQKRVSETVVKLQN